MFQLVIAHNHCKLSLLSAGPPGLPASTVHSVSIDPIDGSSAMQAVIAAEANETPVYSYQTARSEVAVAVRPHASTPGTSLCDLYAQDLMQLN